MGLGVALAVGTDSVGAALVAEAAGDGAVAVFGKAARSGRPATVNLVTSGKASMMPTASAATPGGSTKRRRRGARVTLVGSMVPGGGSGGVAAARTGGAQSRCREQLAHQLSIA